MASNSVLVLVAALAVSLLAVATAAAPECDMAADRFKIREVGHRVVEGPFHDDTAGVSVLDTTLEFEHPGYVESWVIFAARGGRISLQVWRANATTSAAAPRYSLVGENTFEAQEGKQAVLIPRHQQIHARSGDVVGFRLHEGGAQLSYDSAAKDVVALLQMADSDEGAADVPGNARWTNELADGQPAVGDTVAFWNGEQRTYALRVKERTCAIHSCAHGGRLNVTTCECECSFPYGGLQCNACVNSCGVNGAPANGTCACACFEGWSGAMCNVCVKKCANGGELDRFGCTCDCPAPFAGAQCRQCALDACVHGTAHNETCLCACENGWKGERCDVRVTDSLFFTSSSMVDRMSVDGMPSRAFTVEMWLKPWQSRLGTLMYYYGSFGGGIRLANEKNLEVMAGSFESAKTGVSLNDGRWHHVALSWEAATGKVTLFKDGCEAWTHTYGADHELPNGGRLTVGNHVHGYLTDFRIYATARSEEQVRADMFSVVSGGEAGLALAWPLDEGAGEVAGDRVRGSTAQDGTIWGGANWETVRPPLSLNAEE